MTMFKFENVTKTQMLIGIGIAKAFIMSGKLRTRGNFPLEQLLDAHAQSGGDLNTLLAALATAAGAADQCGLDFDLEDQDITDILGKDEFPTINELPACKIAMTLGYKTTAKKDSGELSILLDLSLANDQDMPAIHLAFTLSGQHLQNVIPLLKSQFLNQNRITELVNQLALSALVKASGRKKVKYGKARATEFLLYQKMVNDMDKRITEEAKETVWLYAENSLAGFNAFAAKKVIHFSVSVGIQVSDKITLSLDFAKKTKKR